MNLFSSYFTPDIISNFTKCFTLLTIPLTESVSSSTLSLRILFKPRPIKGPEDYRPGTTKGKIDGHTIWVVNIKMPKELIGNFKHGQDIETTTDYQDAQDAANAS